MRWHVASSGANGRERWTNSRVGQSVTLCGKYVFVNGGVSHETEFGIDDAVYDSVSDQWRRLRDSVWLHYHTACLVDDKIIALSGLNHRNQSAMPNCLELDLASETIRPVETRAGKGEQVLPCCRHIAAYIEWKREIILFGGKRVDSWDFTNQVASYHVDRKEWTLPRNKGQKPEPQSSHVACHEGNKVYILATYDEAERANLYVMDCSRSYVSWSSLPMRGRSPPGLYAGAMNVTNSRIVLFGGYLDAVRQHDLYIYALKSQRWAKCLSETEAEESQDADILGVQGAFPQPIGRHHGILHEGKIRFYGGTTYCLDDIVQLEL